MNWPWTRKSEKITTPAIVEGVLYVDEARLPEATWQRVQLTMLVPDDTYSDLATLVWGEYEYPLPSVTLTVEKTGWLDRAKYKEVATAIRKLAERRGA